MSGGAVADVLAVGLFTPVGGGAAQTATSVRARINRFADSSVFNKRFAPMVLSLLPEELLPPLEGGIDPTGMTSRRVRLLRLAAPALRELAAAAPDLSGAPLFLGAPEGRDGRPSPVDESFPGLLARQAGVAFDVAASRVFPHGRAAGLVALREAASHVAGRGGYALAGGVDSYLDLYLLGTLDSEDRIMAEGAMDAFIPGEGAGFLLLGAGSAAGKAGAAPLARIAAVETGAEVGHRYSREPYRGEGLADTVKRVLAPTGIAKIRTVYAGYNGESFFAKEWGVAYLRSSARFADPFAFEHPAESLGDAGAALGTIMTGLAALGIHRGKDGAPCLVWCSSDREERGALVLDRPDGAGQGTASQPSAPPAGLGVQ